jgi:hypothetical protein
MILSSRDAHVGRWATALAAAAIAGLILTGCQADPGRSPSKTSSETESETPSETPSEEPADLAVPGSDEIALTVAGQAFAGSGETLDATYVLYTPDYWDSANGTEILAWLAATGDVPDWATPEHLAINNTMLGVVDISATLQGDSWPNPGEIGIALGPGDAQIFRGQDLGITSPAEGWTTLDGATSSRAIIGFQMPEATEETLTPTSWAEFFEYWGMLDLSGSDEWDFNPEKCTYEPSATTAGIGAVQAWGFYNDGASCFAGIGH